MNNENKFIKLIREQPLLVIGSIVGIIFLIFAFWLFTRGGDSDTGDIAPPDSGAFLVYEDSVYSPFGSFKADDAIRDDIAFFANQTVEAYESPVDVGVVFIVDKYEPVKNNIISFSGKFSEAKGTATVTAERLPYDIVKVSISWEGRNIDDQLPSASAKNQYIATLPIEEKTYQIAYSPDTDQFIITPTVTGDKPVQDATKVIKEKLGDAYTEESITINYPGYLKGNTNVDLNTTRESPDSDPDDHSD